MSGKSWCEEFGTIYVNETPLPESRSVALPNTTHSSPPPHCAARRRGSRSRRVHQGRLAGQFPEPVRGQRLHDRPPRNLPRPPGRLPRVRPTLRHPVQRLRLLRERQGLAAARSLPTLATTFSSGPSAIGTPPTSSTGPADEMYIPLKPSTLSGSPSALISLARPRLAGSAKLTPVPAPALSGIETPAARLFTVAMAVLPSRVPALSERITKEHKRKPGGGSSSW